MCRFRLCVGKATDFVNVPRTVNKEYMNKLGVRRSLRSLHPNPDSVPLFVSIFSAQSPASAHVGKGQFFHIRPFQSLFHVVVVRKIELEEMGQRFFTHGNKMFFLVEGANLLHFVVGQGKVENRDVFLDVGWIF